MISFGLVLFLTPAAVLLSGYIRSRIALPLLTAIAGYFPFLIAAQVSFTRGFLLLFWWSVVLTVSVIWRTNRDPERTSALIWRSRDYTESMMRWIETGRLPEGPPLSVLRFHVTQTLIYCALALISANFLALVLGSALLNYMNFYVVTVVKRSSNRGKTVWMAWNPWSIIRVLTFLYLGIVASTPALWLLIPVPWSLRLKLLVPAIVGLVADLILKLTLSKKWSSRLNSFQATAPVTQS